MTGGEVGDDDRGGVLVGWLIEDGGGRVGFAEWVASGCFFFFFFGMAIGCRGTASGVEGG